MWNVGKTLGVSEIQDLSTCTYLCSSECGILCVDYFVDFWRNDKLLHLKNNSDWSSVYTCEYYVI